MIDMNLALVENGMRSYFLLLSRTAARTGYRIWNGIEFDSISECLSS